MWVISRVALFAAWACVLLSLGDDVIAWSPSRPATSPKTVVPTESHFLKWASAGFLAASLAFAPLTAYAEEATINEPPPTAITVKVESNSLTRSIEDSGGQLNKDISSVVKNGPSSSNKFDSPKEETEAIRAASKEESTVSKQEVSPSDAAEEVIVDQKEKTTAEKVEEKVIEEPKAQVVEQVKEKVKVIEEPKAQVVEQVGEKVIEEPKAQVVEQVEEKVVEEPKAQVVEQVEEKVIEKPKAQVVEQVDETAREAVTVAGQKKTTEAAQLVEEAAETPVEAPIMKVDESRKEELKVQRMKEVPEDVVVKGEREPESLTTKSPAKQIVEDESELINTMSAKIASFWKSPSGYAVTLPSPGGQEGLTYELSKLDLVGGSLLGLGASYYFSYQFYEYEIEQEKIAAKKKKEAAKAKAKAKAAADKKKGEKAAKPAVASSGLSFLDEISSRGGSTSSELLLATETVKAPATKPKEETVTAKAPAAKPKEETVTAKAPAVSPTVVTAPAVSPSGDSTMDAFARALAAMTNPAQQNGQSNPAASSRGAKVTEEVSRPVAKSGSSYLDYLESLSKR